MTNQSIIGASGRELTRVVGLADLAAGELKLVRIGKSRVAICIAEGEVRAVAARCTHAHAMLAPGNLTADGLIECPLHGAMFSPVDGSVKCAPANVPLPVYEVRVIDGEIFVDLGPGAELVDQAASVTKPGSRPAAAQWGNWK
jgi:3-phenylpropionate/trans-cinnamate dioxygenase ferredoxin component